MSRGFSVYLTNTLSKDLSFYTETLTRQTVSWENRKLQIRNKENEQLILRNTNFSFSSFGLKVRDLKDMLSCQAKQATSRAQCVFKKWEEEVDNRRKAIQSLLSVHVRFDCDARYATHQYRIESN